MAIFAHFDDHFGPARGKFLGNHNLLMPESLKNELRKKI